MVDYYGDHNKEYTLCPSFVVKILTEKECNHIIASVLDT
jgi:hypothetical protein